MIVLKFISKALEEVNMLFPQKYKKYKKTLKVKNEILFLKEFAFLKRENKRK